jgi:tudor domain-containing protein 1/4/6/7
LSNAPQNIKITPEQMISFHAVASHIKSLTELWIQLETKTVNSIMERLDVLGRHPEFIKKKNFVASVGKPCLAFYREPDDFFPDDDGRWYR